MDPQITQIFQAVQQGDATASEALLPLVYEELRRLARQKMGQERAGHTLAATELVHEAYMRLIGGDGVNWSSRGHFFGAAAEAMRRILIEHARRKKAIRHGGGRGRQAIDDEIPEITAGGQLTDDLLDLDYALERLALEDRPKAELVKLRYFAGLSTDEAAAAMGISRATAQRYWMFAKAWLHDAVTSQNGGTEQSAGE